MELLVLIVGLAVLFAPIGALVALSQARALRRRVDELEAALARSRAETSRRTDLSAETDPSATAAAARPTPTEADAPTASAPARVVPPPLPVSLPFVRSDTDAADLGARAVPNAAENSAPAAAPSAGPDAANVHAPAAAAPRAQQRAVRAGLEHWLGVRGSAVVGGLAAAAAALLYFRHAFEQGWITEPLRVASGFAAGAVLIGVGLLFVRRGYRFAPQALVGAGLTTLYGACWAASRRYELWSTFASWIAMAAVTALAVLLALRLRSQFVGVLGLLGGFATPLVVESHFDGPWRLFVYVLVLDIGLLEVARRRTWNAFLPLALVGSLVLHVVLVARDFDPQDHLSLLVILGALAFVFAFGGRRRAGDDAEDVVTSAARALALLAPLGFALHFALRTDFSAPPWTVGVLGACTALGAAVLARRREFEWLPWAVSLGSLAVFHTSLARHGSFSWTWTVVCLAVSLVPALAFLAAPVLGRGLDADARAAHRRALSVGLVAALFVHFELLLYVALAFEIDDGTALRLALSCTVASALAAFVARSADIRWSVVALALCAAATAAIASARVEDPLALADAWPWSALTAVAVCGLFAAAAWRSDDARRSDEAQRSDDAQRSDEAQRSDDTRRTWAHAATASAALVSLVFAAWHVESIGADSLWALAFVVALALAAVHAAVGTRRFELALAASAAAAIACAQLDGPWLRHAAALCAAAFVVVGMGGRVFAANASAALSGGAALVLLACVALPTSSTSDGALLLRAAPFVALGLAADVWSVRREPATRHTSSAAAAVLVAAIAIAIEVDHEPLAFGAGLTALGWAVLAHRRGDTALIVASCCVALVPPIVLSMRLFAPPHHELPSRLLFDELALVHLVPAAGALASVFALRRRARNGDDELDFLGAFTGAGAVLLVMLWTSLEVIAFHTLSGPLRWPATDAGAPQLALSTSWIAIAVLLLLTGLAAHSVGMRWASLGVLLAALVKVFLFDLAHLEGLARVGSLAGLALASLGVSLLYQRFVLRPSAARD